MVFLCAEQNAYGRIVTVGCHVLFVPAHIGVELTDVFVAKDAAFNSINPILKLKDIFDKIVQGFLKSGIIG